MAKKIMLNESAYGLPKAKDNKYLVKLIGSNVQGSSGFYSHEMLEQYAGSAFPKGTKIFLDHPTASEAEERPIRSVKHLAGKTVSDVEMREDGVYAQVQFARDYQNLIEDFHDVLGMSIHVQGEVEESEDASGNIVRNVTSLYPSPLNSVDLVTVAGAEGRVSEKLAESFRVTERTVQVDEKDIKAIAEAVKAALEAPITTLAEAVDALKPAAPMEDDKENEPDLAAVTESAVEAGLPKSARIRVVEAVRLGADADEAIKAEQGYIEQVLAEAGQDAAGGKIVESGGTTDYATAISEMFKAGDK